MRGIETQEIKERKQLRLKVIMGIVLIGLMVSSTIGFALVFNSGGLGGKNGGSLTGSVEDTIMYNRIEFTRSSGFWQAIIDEKVIVTRHNPEETEGIIDIQVSTSDFIGKTLYYTTDDESASAIQEIVQNIGGFALRSQEACLENIECRNENLVIKTCSDNIIILTLSNQTKAYKEDNCIFLEASSNEANLISDALVFKALGIQ